MSLQLYQVDNRSYLLDFKSIDGQSSFISRKIDLSVRSLFCSSSVEMDAVDIWELMGQITAIKTPFDLFPIL